MIDMVAVKKYITILCLFFLTFTFFQNCAKTKLQTSEVQSSESQLVDPFTPSPEILKFFNYNYKIKPNIYANLALLFPKESVGNFAKFTFLGMLTPADGSSGSISYQVSIKDDLGRSVCVGDNGYLNANEQNVSFECLGSPNLAKANVTLKANYNGFVEEFSVEFVK